MGELTNAYWVVLLIGIPSVTLAATGVHHLFRLPSFVEAIVQQEIFSRRAAKPIAFVTAVAEFCLALAAGVLFLRESILGIVVTAVLISLLLGMFGFYLLHISRTGRRVPCACGGWQSTASLRTAQRAFALSTSAFIGAVVATTASLGHLSRPMFAMAILSILALVLLIWHLPLIYDNLETLIRERNRPGQVKEAA